MINISINFFKTYLWWSLSHLLFTPVLDAHQVYCIPFEITTASNIVVQYSLIYQWFNNYFKIQSLHISGALRNLTEESNSYRLYVTAQQGLELLLKVSQVLENYTWIFFFKFEMVK